MIDAAAEYEAYAYPMMDEDFEAEYFAAETLAMHDGKGLASISCREKRRSKSLHSGAQKETPQCLHCHRLMSTTHAQMKNMRTPGPETTARRRTRR